MNATSHASSSRNTSAIQLDTTIASGLSGCGPIGNGIVPPDNVTTPRLIAIHSASATQTLRCRITYLRLDANLLTRTLCFTWSRQESPLSGPLLAPGSATNPNPAAKNSGRSVSRRQFFAYCECPALDRRREAPNPRFCLFPPYPNPPSCPKIAPD